MKTFQQFQEETPKGLPNIEKSLERTAKGVGKTINPADVKDFVIKNVKKKFFDKFGVKDDQEAIDKVKGFVDDKVTTMSDELPKVINQFSDKLPEIEKTTTKFFKGLKTGDLPAMKKKEK